MMFIKNATSLDGNTIDLTRPSEDDQVLDAHGLLLMPALIDPHVHFRTPGYEHKENWETAAKASLCGGYTTVFDMPNTHPATITEERLKEKKALIDAQLAQAGIPLRYHLYFGVDKHHFEEIVKVKDSIIALKIYMGSSTGDLLMNDASSLHAAFALAEAHDLLVCVHAEDERMIEAHQKLYVGHHDFATHSKIRSPAVALSAVKTAIDLSRLYHTRLHILHISTQEEVLCIKKAKEEGLSVTCETTPHHLFLNTTVYPSLQGQAQVNPPLREPFHNQILLDALHEGIIDVIGSDHAPHTLEEKQRPYGIAPSGMPGIETTLPLLLTAYHQKKISLQQIIQWTRYNIETIYQLPPNDDLILVDLHQKKTILNHLLHTRCGWSPFANHTLQGWPIYAVVKGQIYHLEQLKHRSIWIFQNN
jgi:dihydroorotase